MVVISRNPMTGEICAVEHDSGHGMMVRLLRGRVFWIVLTIAAYIAGRWRGAHVRHAHDDDADTLQDVGSEGFGQDSKFSHGQYSIRMLAL